MVLILISWVYIFFTAVSMGVAMSRFLRISSDNVTITSFLGLFLTTLFAGCWAFFGNIGYSFHTVLLLLNIVFFIRYRNDIKAMWILLKSDFFAFSQPLKIAFAFIFVLLLLTCAASPSLVDNESYYIQTIKWLNEYGLVKGLINLHLFLGQTSGWHITQSVFSFSFLYDRFNDLNGFALLLFNFFAFKKLQDYFNQGNATDLLLGLFTLANVFFFPFVNAPSPDLPVYLLSFLIFGLYLNKEQDAGTFTKITALAVFAVLVKITAVVLLLFPLLLVFHNFSKITNRIAPVVIVSLAALILFVAKNIILTGYPLFPLTLFRIDELDYVFPKTIMDYFFSLPEMSSFYYPVEAYHAASLNDKLQHYFLYNGFHSIMGCFTLLMAAIAPFIIIKQQHQKPFWVIYEAFAVLLILLIFSSPQYRFYIQYAVFFGLLLTATILKSKRYIMISLTLSLLTIPVAVGSQLSKVPSAPFIIESCIVPRPNTPIITTYALTVKGNLQYHSPTNNHSFWFTGNGNLPCVNTEQLDYFATYFYYVPQLRGHTLKDGFYSKNIYQSDQ